MDEAATNALRVERSQLNDAPTRVGSIPTRTPGRVPTRGGRGPDRRGPHREPLPPETQLVGGAYRILDVLGAGGFSVTYLGQERSRGVRVAIKELFPIGCVRHGLRVEPGAHWKAKDFAAALEDFVREGQMLKYFNHPSIVQCYSPFEENGTGYLAMELLEGESLLQGMERRGAMNQQQALEVARQLCGALELVHTGNIIHADIKPENIILTAGSRFVLFDFGISRRYYSGRSTKAAIVAVSPGYSPPEQYQASQPLTPATDVYSLAATLFTLLAMQAPPDAPRRQSGMPLPPLRALNPTVTHEFSMALEQALHLDPQQRPQSMDVFFHHLQHHVGGGGVQLHTAAALSFSVEKVGEFPAHRGGVHSLLLHPGHPLILSGGRQGAVGMWSWEGREMGRLQAHETPLCGFAISPTGDFLATAGDPGDVRVWNVEDGRLLSQVRSGMPAVRSLSFLSDGRTVAVGTTDGTVQLFGDFTLELPGHTGDVNALSASPDGVLLASGGHDGLIRIWDARTFRPLLEFAHQRPVLHLRFSPDSKLLLSGSSDNTTRIWDIQANLELRRYREHGAVVQCVSFTCDPDVVVSACGDKKLRFYRLSSGRMAGSVETDSQYAKAVACAPGYPVLASAGGDGVIRLWKFDA